MDRTRLGTLHIHDNVHSMGWHPHLISWVLNPLHAYDQKYSLYPINGWYITLHIHNNLIKIHGTEFRIVGANLQVVCAYSQKLVWNKEQGFGGGLTWPTLVFLVPGHQDVPHLVAWHLRHKSNLPMHAKGPLYSTQHILNLYELAYTTVRPYWTLVWLLWCQMEKCC